MQQRPATAAQPPLRVRFAPSVGEDLHLSAARTALFNWLWARKRDGVLVLRVEDHDAERCTDAGLERLREDLRWLGLDWDEGPGLGGPFGPYQRTLRRVLYRAEADRLLRQGRAYRCFCAPGATPPPADELAEGVPPRHACACPERDPREAESRSHAGHAHCVRLRMPVGEDLQWNDLVHGELVFAAAALDDVVLLAPGGAPSDDFAAVVDDAKMHISHVLRGREELERTPAQLAIYDALGYVRPDFGHLPAIVGPDGQPLVPGVGEPTVAQCRARGILPHALLNCLALLGWRYDGSHEVFTPHEIVAHFDLRGVRRGATVFDVEKLLWLNRQHYERLPLGAKLETLLPQLKAHGLWPPRFRVDLGPPRHFRVVTGSQDEKIAASIQPIPEEEWMRREPTMAEELPRLAQILAAVGDEVTGPHDVAAALACFYDDGFAFDPRAVSQHLHDTSAAQLSTLAVELETLQPFVPESLEAAVHAAAARLGTKPAALRQAVLVALTGRDRGPSVFDVLYLLGRHKSLERLRRAGDIVRHDRELPAVPVLRSPSGVWRREPRCAPPASAPPDDAHFASGEPPGHPPAETT